MRRLTLDALRATIEKAFAKKDEAHDALAIHTAQHGPMCAAWLIFHHRDRFHRCGALDFKIPSREETPPWFRIAFECLKTRPGWTATMRRLPECRIYTITWHSWTVYLRNSRVPGLALREIQ